MVSGTWTLGGAQHSTYSACDDDDDGDDYGDGDGDHYNNDDDDEDGRDHNRCLVVLSSVVVVSTRRALMPSKKTRSPPVRSCRHSNNKYSICTLGYFYCTENTLSSKNQKALIA